MKCALWCVNEHFAPIYFNDIVTSRTSLEQHLALVKSGHGSLQPENFSSNLENVHVWQARFGYAILPVRQKTDSPTIETITDLKISPSIMQFEIFSVFQMFT